MRKHLIFTTIIATLTLALSGCEEVVDFEITDSDRYVAVNALPCADSTLYVNLSYSRFFLDNTPFQPVSNASITMTVNGTALASPTRQGSNYTFGYFLNGGDSLYMTINIPGRLPISTYTHIPNNPAIGNFKAEIDTLQPITAGEMSFTLTDESNLRNYYYIYVSERDSGTQWNRWENKWDTIDTVRHTTFSCLDLAVTDPSVNLSMGIIGYYQSLLFSDSLIDGEVHDMLLSIPMLKDTAEHPIQRDYTLVIESLSPEAYRYRVDVSNAHSATSYFSEPTNPYSNITGTIGIFAGIAIKKIPITFTYKEAVEEKSKSNRQQ